MHLDHIQKFWLCLLVLGIVLFVSDILYKIHLTNNWEGYANWGEVNEHLDYWNPPGETDPYLIWMLRSKEYRQNNENGKHNMRMSWAEEYRDRRIGRWSRIVVIYLLMFFGFSGTVFGRNN